MQVLSYSTVICQVTFPLSATVTTYRVFFSGNSFVLSWNRHASFEKTRVQMAAVFIYFIYLFGRASTRTGQSPLTVTVRGVFKGGVLGTAPLGALTRGAHDAQGALIRDSALGAQGTAVR